MENTAEQAVFSFAGDGSARIRALTGRLPWRKVPADVYSNVER